MSATGHPATPDTAVILAAGLGSRLGPRGQVHPKGFICFDDGEPIIEQSLRKMRAAGVRRIVIVTGHLAACYATLALAYPGVVELVHNPLYAESGSMYSLHQVRDRVQGDFWLFESDLVYERRALDVLAQVRSGSALLMSGPTGSGDEVYVEAPAGRLAGLSKNRAQLGEVHGELVGITRIDRDCFGAMNRHAGRIFATGMLRMEYEQALVAAAQEVPVQCPLVPDLAWSEIDTESHWSRVHDRVYPEILRRDRAATGGKV